MSDEQAIEKATRHAAASLSYEVDEHEFRLPALAIDAASEILIAHGRTKAGIAVEQSGEENDGCPSCGQSSRDYAEIASG